MRNPFKLVFLFPLILLGAGCSQSNAVAPPTSTTSTMWNVDSKLTACNVFTPEQVKVVFGSDLGNGKVGPEDFYHAKDNEMFTSCNYTSDSDGSGATLAIYEGPDTEHVMNVFYAFPFNGTKPTKDSKLFQSVPQLGDEAYLASPNLRGVTLNVLKGNRVYRVAVYGKSPADAQMMEENLVAKTIASEK